MKDKLRELAAEWLRKGEFSKNSGAPRCGGQMIEDATELLAILDAEGDGGAVSCEAMRLLIAIREDDYLSDSSRHRIDTLRNTRPARSGVVSDEDVFYIDCEFDGHNGPLLSMALVAKDGRGVHITTDEVAHDPWVIANVLPLLDKHNATNQTKTTANGVGDAIRAFIGDCESPEIVADSPVDIARFCAALSTNASGQWASADYPRMTFRVENVDCYPTTLVGAVQHNAWWDAMALRHKIDAAIQGERHER